MSSGKNNRIFWHSFHIFAHVLFFITRNSIHMLILVLILTYIEGIFSC